MDLTRAKVLLNKMNRLLEGMEPEDELSAIERDLMRAYLRDLYDYFLYDSEESFSSGKEIQEVRSESDKIEEQKASSPATSGTDLKEADSNDDGLSIPRIQPEEEEEGTPEVKKEVQAGQQLQSNQEKSVEEDAPPPQEDSAGEKKDEELDEELKELFDVQEGNELSERLSHMPVRDLSRAMGLNERIYTINELFGGDHALFDRVLEKLNKLDSFSEAKEYLTGAVAKKYEWTHPDKKKKAHHFIRLVRRRYKRQVV